VIVGERQNPEYDQRLLALQEDEAALRSQVREARERLDFAERVLARAEPPKELQPRASSSGGLGAVGVH
jgi:hypothetical protein